MNIEFKSGEFVALRATTKFHLGALERDLHEGEVIHFDGNIAKIGNTEHSLPVIRSAVRSGWLVPTSDTTTKYRPQPANVAVRPAQSTGKERGATVDVQTVHEEDRDLGNLKKVRDRGDGIVRKHALIIEEGGSEGVPVGRLKSAAKRQTTITAENVMRLTQEIRKVDNVEGSPEQRVIPIAKAVATGDVQEARVGDELDELLGESATSSEVPAPGEAGEGNDPHLTAEEKSEKAAKAARLKAAPADAEAARQARYSQVGKSAPPATLTPTPAAPAPAPAPASGGTTLASLAESLPAIKSVLEAHGIDDLETLRDVLRDSLAGAELARDLKAGPTMKLRKALGIT
jgi:uncharacterized protein YdaT